MKKLITSVGIAGLMLYLPLWNRFDLMLDPKLLFPTLCSLWLLVKQKDLDWSKIKESAPTDGYSTLWIVLGGMVSQALAVLEWRFSTASACRCFNFIDYVGVALLFGGLALRLNAIETLDKFFTNEVKVEKGWELIQIGIYKYLRHPSYLGGYLSMLGTLVLLESYISLLISAILLFIIYVYRIRLEEQALIKHFGKRYSDYSKQTLGAMFPFFF